MNNTLYPIIPETNRSIEPLVSVIISNYNYGNFLAQAIDSVFAQTYRNFEIIVVDDGSTDQSREVIGAYGGSITAVFQQNSGQGAGFNTGLTHAQGEIVCFLDADDYYKPEKLEKVVNAFNQHSEWVQISHGRISVDREGKPIGEGYKTHNQGDVSHLLLKWGKYAWSITSGLAYRRSVLEQVLPIPTQRTEAADTYLTAVVPFYGKVGSINEPLMFHRFHGHNLQAYNDNLSFLIKQRELTASYINTVADKLNLATRFQIQHDVDYRCLKIIHEGRISWVEPLEILWLSLRESIAIRRSPKDFINRLLRHAACVLLQPAESKAVLRLGLRNYLRCKVFRTQANYG